MALALAALLFAVVAVAASAVFAFVRGVELWRTIRAFPGAVGRELETLDARVGALGSREPREHDAMADSVARLQRSWAQLSLLLRALTRVREQASGLLAIYPRK